METTAELELRAGFELSAAVDLPAPVDLSGVETVAGVMSDAELAEMVDAVFSAGRLLAAVAARSLADLADEVTPPQFRLLAMLASRGPQGIASLAKGLAVTPPTASRLCERLVRKGLVRRRAGRDDRRQVRVTLTSTGKDLVAMVTRRRRLEISGLLESVPPGARRSVVEGLQLLAKAAGEVPEQNWSTGWEL